MRARAWITLAERLRRGERVVLAQPEPALRELAGPAFELKACFPQRVHRSLTRHIALLERRA